MRKQPIPLYGCCRCSEECSLSKEDLRWHNDELWCNDCYSYADATFRGWPKWCELERFVPKLERENVELKKLNKIMLDGLERECAIRKDENGCPLDADGQRDCDDCWLGYAIRGGAGRESMMTKFSDELFERSKRDNEMIVGSEIRAAIAELRNMNTELRKLNQQMLEALIEICCNCAEEESVCREYRCKAQAAIRAAKGGENE